MSAYYDGNPLAQLEIRGSEGELESVTQQSAEDSEQKAAQSQTKKRPGRPSKHPEITRSIVEDCAMWYRDQKRKNAKRKNAKVRVDWKERARYYFPDAGERQKELAAALQKQVHDYKYALKKRRGRRKKRDLKGADVKHYGRSRFRFSKTADSTEGRIYRLMADELNNGSTVYYTAEAIRTSVRHYPVLERTFVYCLDNPTEALNYLKTYGLRLAKPVVSPPPYPPPNPPPRTVKPSLASASLWIQTLRDECKQALRSKQPAKKLEH